MAKVGAQRAAELTGKSKSTVQRAMNSGKISYELDANGRRVIDVSELERAFGLKQDTAMGTITTVEQELEKAQSMLEAERLKMRIQALEEQLESSNAQIEDLKDQRDQWQKQASQVLITSQHSQKQADELRAELKERDRRAKERRQQRIEQQMQKLKPDNENTRAGQSTAGEGFNFGQFWKRMKNAS